jgi:hypothetical protein
MVASPNDFKKNIKPAITQSMMAVNKFITYRTQENSKQWAGTSSHLLTLQ